MSAGNVLSDLIGTLKTAFSIGKLTIDTSGLTAARSQVVPDKAGTFAMTSDVTTEVISGTALSSWTPTLGGLTLGNGTLACRYKPLGKLTFFVFSLTIGSTTSFSGSFTFTLPITGVATTTGLQVGTGKIWNHTNGDFWDLVGIKTSTTVVGLYALYTGLSKSFVVNSTYPMTLTAGETLTLSGFYEAA